MAGAPPPLTPGTIFARDFKIVRALAAGGMGAVYVAEQLSTGQQRALKVMLPSLVLDPKLRERFEQEARVGARVASEHVVGVVAAGIDEETESPWLAMELLHGEELSKLVERQGALAAPLVLEIAEQLCHAVGAAHAAGIVHRDLKPENLFVAESHRAGARSMVKVLDFGIAKVVADAKPGTETAAIGSPLWMSPEQTARGGLIAPQCDVWAIGLIVFHLLTGRFFWRAAEESGASMASLLREICLDPMPTASERAKELGRSDALPSGFDAWFEKSVNRDVHQRFPNATEQLEALRAVLKDAPISKDTVRDTSEAPPAPLKGQSTTVPLNVPVSASVPVPGSGSANGTENTNANDRAKRQLRYALVFSAFTLTAVVLGWNLTHPKKESATPAPSATFDAPSATLATPSPVASALSVGAQNDAGRSEGALDAGSADGSADEGGTDAGARPVLLSGAEYRKKGREAAARGDWVGAQTQFEYAINQNIKDYEAVCGAAEAARHRRTFTTAQKYYLFCKDLRPDYLPGALGFADLEWDLHDYAVARGSYQAILERFGESAVPPRVKERANAHPEAEKPAPSE